MNRKLIAGVLATVMAFSVYASDVKDWDTTDSNNNSAAPNGAPEGMAPSAVNDTMRAMMGAVARFYSDIGGAINTAGTSNTYTYASGSGITAYADGDIFAFEANHTNTGAATLNVDSVGAQSLVTSEGAALTGGEIVSGGRYLVSYDLPNTNWMLIGVGTTAQPSLNLTGTADVDLSDNGNALNVGTESGAHLALSTDIVQAKSNATTATDLKLNELGGNVYVGASGLAANTTVNVGAATGQNPAVELAENGTSKGRVRYESSANAVDIQPLVTGERVRILDDSGFSAIFDPDDAATLYFNGSAKLATVTGGVSVTGSVVSSSAGASTTAIGTVELATAAETLAGTDATRAITPDGFADSLTTNSGGGSMTLPGGLIIKWDLSASIPDDTTGSVTWTGDAFSNAGSYQATCTPTTAPSGGADGWAVSSLSTTSATIWNDTDNATTFRCIAIGY